MQLNLTTHLNEELFKSGEKFLYFGFINAQQHKIIKEKYNKVDFDTETTLAKELKERHEYCEKVYQRILTGLTNNLNELHNVKFSERMWEVILGRWTRDFIYVAFKNYRFLKNLFEKKNVKKIFTTDTEEFSLLTFDYLSLVYANSEQAWVEALNSKLIDHLNPNIEIHKIKKTANFVDRFKRKQKKKAKLLSSFLPLLGGFYNKIFNKKNDAIIYQSGLSFFYEKKLEFALRQFPKKWKIPDVDYDDNIDVLTRRKLKTKINPNDNFEEFLKKILHLCLPKFIVENFGIINKISEKIFPVKNPAFVMSGFGFGNEVFNFYIAKNIEKGIPYILVQHGNSYHTHIESNYYIEAKIADYFLTWGANNKKNQIPIYNFNTIGKNFIFNSSGNLSVICDQVFYTPSPSPHNGFLRQMRPQDTISLVNELNENVKIKTYFRLFPKDRLKAHPYFEESIKNHNLKIYNKNETYKNILKKTRLCLFNYDSTGLYENLCLNIPSISYCKYINEFLNKKYITIYQNLFDAKILFDDKKKLLNHINFVWGDINEWWLDEYTQEKIRIFNNEVNLPYKNNFNKLVLNLKKIKNTKQYKPKKNGP